MPLYVKSAKVGDLADRLAAARRVTKTKAVEDALTEALERIPVQEEQSEVVRKVMKLIGDFHARYPPTGLKADKAFIDSLYED